MKILKNLLNHLPINEIDAHIRFFATQTYVIIYSHFKLVYYLAFLFLKFLCNKEVDTLAFERMRSISEAVIKSFLQIIKQDGLSYLSLRYCHQPAKRRCLNFVNMLSRIDHYIKSQNISDGCESAFSNRHRLITSYFPTWCSRPSLASMNTKCSFNLFCYQIHIVSKSYHKKNITSYNLVIFCLDVIRLRVNIIVL